MNYADTVEFFGKGFAIVITAHLSGWAVRVIYQAFCAAADVEEP